VAPLDAGFVEPPELDVTVTGEVTSKLRGRHYFVYVSGAPCAPPTTEAMLYGKDRINPARGSGFSVSATVPEGAPAHLCAATLDEKGRVTGVGEAAGSPLAIPSGEAKVRLTGLRVSIEALKKPGPTMDQLVLH
jgi:hypothetical protein